MRIYQGVVEDIKDPMKLSRVKVRVFGLHTEDKSKISTESLPWATVAFPTTSASMSGVGASPSGLLKGSWVYVFFTDPDEQYPVVFAALPAKPKDDKKPKEDFGDEDKSENQAEEDRNDVTDKDGDPIEDSDGNKLKDDSKSSDSSNSNSDKQVSTNSREVDPTKLGSISKQYESNGNPGAINNYKKSDDKGGASYGAYQLISGTKDGNSNNPSNSSVNNYLKQSKYGSEFAGLKPATPAFDSKWKEVANREGSAFLADQHKYIERNYYQPAVNKLPSEITSRGAAVHEAIWSMSVQLGPQGAVNKINSAVGKPSSGVSDQALIKQIYDSRVSTVQSDFRSSPGQWNDLRNRFSSESSALVNLANNYSSGSANQPTKMVSESKNVYTENGVTQQAINKLIPDTSQTASGGSNSGGGSNLPFSASSGGGGGGGNSQQSAQSQPQNENQGFCDPDGTNPTKCNEPDTNRLACGVTKDTCVKTKRNSLITGCNAGDVQISEPPTQYNAKYPYNHVTETESGHIMEFDDTPEYERIHTWHKSGTFSEYHPDGGLVTKVKKKRTDVVIDDWDSICVASENTFVGKDFNKSIAGKSVETVKETSKYIVRKLLEIISEEKIKLNAPVVEINSKGKKDSKAKFAQSKDQIPISKAVTKNPAKPKKETDQSKKDDEAAAKKTDDYTASQNDKGQNPYKNEEAAKDGIKENYPGTPEDNDVKNKETQKSDNEKKDIVSTLDKRLAEAAEGKWRETGQGGKESNPNITGMWKDLGFPDSGAWKSDQTPWCAGFVNSVLKESGYDYVQTASAKAIEQNPEKWNATRVNPADARPGDIAVWKQSHVNFVYKNDGGKLSFVGGNQSPQTSNRNPNDGDVTISYRNGTSANNPNISSIWRVNKRG